MRWQFPASEPADQWVGSVELRRSYESTPATLFISEPSTGEQLGSFDTDGIQTYRFIVDHDPTGGTFGSWVATMSLTIGGRVPDPEVATGPTRGSQQETLRQAAVIWAYCYQTSEASVASMLCRVLGGEGAGCSAFDAFVSGFFIDNALRYLDTIVSRTLAAVAPINPLATAPDAHGRLLAEVRNNIDSIIAALRSKPFKPGELQNGVPMFDARLAGWLDAVDTRLAKLVRGAGREAAAKGGAAIWARWLPDDKNPPLRQLDNVALALWRKRVVPRLEREAKSSPMRVNAVRAPGDTDDHSPIPKIAAPTSWAIGAPGKEASKVDGEKFGTVPFLGQRALIPRSYSLLPSDRDKYPHQAVMALDTGESDALPVVVSQNQGLVMSTVAGKLALLILASPDVQKGNLVSITLGELARLTHPGSVRVRERELEATMRAMNELDGLSLYLPDTRKVRIFDVTRSYAPARAPAGLRLYYGLTATFQAVLEEIEERAFCESQLKGHEYNGAFLMNITGMLGLSNKEPSLLRYYTRFCAIWNAACVSGHFDPGKVPRLSPEEWAIRANALSDGVVEYLEAKGTGEQSKDRRRKLSDQRKRATDDIEALAGLGLVVLSKDRAGIRPLPPDNWRQAHEAARANGTRPRLLGNDDESLAYIDTHERRRGSR